MMDVLLNALLLSFVLLGIHAYFGMEVVRRGIVFTDIAIAQASAVGLALSLFLFDRPSYLLSLLCSLLAGVLVLLSQRLRDYAEAFIGLLYALGFSLVVLVLSKSPHGMEEFLKLSAKDILFVPKEEVYLDLPTGFSLVFLQALFGILVFISVLFLKGFKNHHKLK